MKKIIKHINQLPKYECHDPSSKKIYEYCIPDLNKEHIVANKINRDQYDGVNLFTERAMKINAQDTADNSSGVDISGEPQFTSLEAVGGASASEVVVKDDEVVVDDERDLYDLVDNFGKRDLSEEKNVEGQFTGQFIKGTNDDGTEYTDDAVKAQSNKTQEEGDYKDWEDKRVKEPSRLMLKGQNRWTHFKEPVANLLLITRKLRDFHKLSLAYVEKHKEVEYLVLTIRKLYYILIFIRDQIKGVEKGMDDLHILIQQIIESTKKHEDDFVYGKRLQVLKERQEALKQDRNALSKAYELASNSLLTRLNKIGATMHDVVDIESMPNSLRNELKESAYAETEQLKKLEENYKKRLYNEDNSIVLELNIPDSLKKDLEANPDVLSDMTKKIDVLLSEQLNDNLNIQDPALTNLSNITPEGDVIDDPISTQYLAGLPVNLTLKIDDDVLREQTAKDLREIIARNYNASGGSGEESGTDEEPGTSTEDTLNVGFRDEGTENEGTASASVSPTGPEESGAEASVASTISNADVTSGANQSNVSTRLEPNKSVAFTFWFFFSFFR